MHVWEQFKQGVYDLVMVQLWLRKPKHDRENGCLFREPTKDRGNERAFLVLDHLVCSRRDNCGDYCLQLLLVGQLALRCDGKVVDVWQCLVRLVIGVCSFEVESCEEIVEGLDYQTTRVGVHLRSKQAVVELEEDLEDVSQVHVVLEAQTVLDRAQMRNEVVK
ncbi:hypothetical protein WICPIJ_007248 [Wickerhamomyces pijperi]|uniref:Uncharacterized protein n=1 Tax=Wickerhamomyces pijperi TaxID=599730 RepID=A0A9P8Q2Z5_WICPI|nr:hypothetical protein WICPIJ_007248 [Wickerhamomyces pijperi]